MIGPGLCVTQRHWWVRLSLPWLAGLMVAGCGGDGDGIMEPESGTLSGTIKIASGSRVDADTALDLEVSDLDSAQAQPIDGVQNPDNPFPGNVIAGGYVSAESGSYSDELDYPRDERDKLRLQLSEGQRVSINFFRAPFNPSGESGTGSDPVTALRLELADDEDIFDETGANKDLNKSVKAPESGNYNLEINATDGGPVRYVLRATSLSGNETLGQESMDFEPGEAIVTEESVASDGAIRAQANGPVELADKVGSQRRLGGNQSRVTMPIERQAELPATASRARRKAATLEWIRELNDTSGVASAVPNHRVRAAQNEIDCATEPEHPECQDEYDRQQWHYELIRAPGAWEDVSGEGVRVAVLDTGITQIDNDWHPDLAPNIDCGPADGCFDAVDGSLPIDDNGSHGTHVSGLAAAAAEDGDGGDVTGVAHDATLVPVRVLGGSEGTVADVIEGVRWVTNDGNPRADVINLSLGSQTENPTLGDAVAEAAEAGILVVAASGNAGDDRPFYPAAFPSVLAVGAVDCERNRSSFSNFGNWLDLVAPGGGDAGDCGNDDEHSVFSTVAEREGIDSNTPVNRRQGTSMASPHVAGVLGLMRERNADVEMPIIRALLREGELTRDNGSGAFDQETGWGLVDAEAAVTKDLSGYAALAPSQERVRLDDDRQSVDLSLERVGDESVTFTNASVTDGDQPWLNVERLSGDRNFRVSLNTDEMEPGQFFRSTLNVRYEANGGEARDYQIPVTATLEADEADRNAGAHFVQLIPADAYNDDSVSEDTVQTLVEARDGRYEFEFDTSDMEPGKYFLIAGSDLDNDGSFCGPGEACAEFPVTGQPEAIEITEDTARRVELETAFTRPVNSQNRGATPIGGYQRLDDSPEGEQP